MCGSNMLEGEGDGTGRGLQERGAEVGREGWQCVWL